MSQDRRIQISVGVTDKIETFDKQFKPLFIFMRISGILPIRYSSKEAWHLSWFWVIYSVIVYISMLLPFYYNLEIFWIKNTHKKSDNRDNTLFDSIQTGNTIISFTMPIFFWPQIYKLIDIFNKITNLQGQLQKYLSPSDIQTSILGRRVYFVCLLNFCIVIVISGINWLQIYAHYKQESVMISHIITSLFNFWIDMSRVWHLVFWCLFHEVLIRMAKIFQTLAFKKSSLHSNWQRHRRIWLDLSQLAREGIGDCLGHFYGQIVILLFINATLAFYQVFKQFIYFGDEYYTLKQPNEQFLLYAELIYLWLGIFTFCNYSDRAQYWIGYETKKYLLFTNFGISKGIQTEVDSFLYIINLFPPKISLSDYVLVDRKLLISLGSMMATYLVVLLQFEMNHKH